MKLKTALVFSADVSAIKGICHGANALAERSVAVVLGSREEAEALCACANEVIWLGEKAEGAMAEAYTGAVEKAIRDSGAELVLLSAGTRDRCIAAKLAVRLDAGVITDASSVEVSENGVTARRNVYGGAAEATVVSKSAVTIVIASAGIFDEQLPAESGKLSMQPSEPEDTGLTLVSTSAKQEESVDLAVAKRIVGVGRGLGSRENLAAVESFAAKIGAEIGCTRPIAEEEHLLARSRYIGVSGATIRPDVYVALGVSGQVQHMVGASDSKVIVAINKDGKAPIFSNCDIGLVADMNKVLPALTELL